MSITAIETALEQKLLGVADLPAIAWEDVDYKPTTGQPYLKVHHLHNNPRDLFLERGPAELPGIFQVSVLYPAGRGKVEAKQLAERIADAFAPVQMLPAGNHRVDLLDTPAIASGFPDGEGWYVVPVSISWQAFPI